MTNHLFKKNPRCDQRAREPAFFETPAGFALTYAAMITLSGRYAEALAELGLKPGDRVAAQVEKSVEALMLLGCVAGQLRGSYDWRPTPVRVYFHTDGTPCKLNAGPQ